MWEMEASVTPDLYLLAKHLNGIYNEQIVSSEASLGGLGWTGGLEHTTTPSSCPHSALTED